jgi:hypothetical protein
MGQGVVNASLAIARQVVLSNPPLVRTIVGRVEVGMALDFIVSEIRELTVAR